MFTVSKQQAVNMATSLLISLHNLISRWFFTCWEPLVISIEEGRFILNKCKLFFVSSGHDL